MPDFKDSLTDPEEKLGADIVRKALFSPARLIAKNAGVDGDVIIERLLGKGFEIGYNAVRLLSAACECVGWLEKSVACTPSKAPLRLLGLRQSCGVATLCPVKVERQLCTAQ